VRLTGHGFATYEDTETRIDPVLASAAGLVAAAGGVSWAILLHRAGWRWRGKRITPIFLSVLAVVAVWAGLTFLLTRESAPFLASEHYTSIDEIVSKLEREGVRCLNVGEQPIGEDKYFRDSMSCGIRSEFGVPDGFDNVSIHIWKDETARSNWLDRPLSEEEDWVMSPTWLVICEFLPTCSDVREALGGRLNVEY
jgi:hypothetical protein